MLVGGVVYSPTLTSWVILTLVGDLPSGFSACCVFPLAGWTTTMLEDVEQVTVSLQFIHHTLLDSRNELYSLIVALHEQQNISGSSLYECKLGTEYI